MPHTTPAAAIETRKVVWSKHGWLYELVVDPEGIEFNTDARRTGLAIRYWDTELDYSNDRTPRSEVSIDGDCLPFVILALIQLLDEPAVDIDPTARDLFLKLAAAQRPERPPSAYEGDVALLSTNPE